MKKILLISNSFGVDATRYFHGLCRKAGEDVLTACLYIGGCPLSRHYRNMLSEESAYQLYINGSETPFKMSLKEALLTCEWDIVTFQQASPVSGDFDSYQPYLDELSAYVKKCVPGAKQYIHAIWGWSDAAVANHHIGYDSSALMYEAIHKAYALAASAINADGFIPATAAMEKLYSAMGEAAYRDGRHAGLGAGRYMLALVWYGVIFGRDVRGIGYRDFDVELTDEQIEIAERCAAEAIAECSYKKA